jgi:hypothetical protein
MKTKYWMLVGIAGLAVTFCYFQLNGNSKQQKADLAGKKKTAADGERHIRGIMKKSKLSV